MAMPPDDPQAEHALVVRMKGGEGANASYNRSFPPEGTDSMGRGDKRSFKGKVFKGSYGKTRPQTEKKKEAATSTQAAHQKKK